jgi:tRNA (guanine6-N2)-methyltransferase
VPVEFLFLPGLGSVVAKEVRDRLPDAGPVHEVPGRSDSLAADYRGDWARLLDLRTIVAPFLVLSFPVPRPRSLTSGEYFPQIMDAVRLVQRINPETPKTFRMDAAGSESAGFQRLASQLEEATGLPQVPEEGQLLLRFRRSPSTEGWDVLVRLSSRPLSSRAWRVANLPGAVNATIAAAMSQLTAPRPGDRAANLMCGSGTLLIERLRAAPARFAVAVDSDPGAVQCCAENVEAAGLRGRVTLLQADIAEPDWAGAGPFDVLLADPPWGTLMGEHETNEALHALLLERAHTVAAPGARLAVLTHEVRIMERCLAEASSQWESRQTVRVFQKGHHPRIYLLTRR